MQPQEQHGSRLSKLLHLIDEGSSLETRKAAAKQIASIVAAHPPQLPSVVWQVSERLRHKSWDARIAAGYCLGEIAENIHHYDPKTLAQAVGIADADFYAFKKGDLASSGIKVEEKVMLGSGPAIKQESSTAEQHFLSLKDFDVMQVLDHGTLLLASGGEEYAFESSASVEEQRNNLKKRLGLGADVFINTSEMFDDKDLDTSVEKFQTSPKSQNVEATDLLAGMVGCSARERALALRKAKTTKRKMATVPVGEINQNIKKQKSEPKNEDRVEKLHPSVEQLGMEELDRAWEAILAGEWPFQKLCDKLLLDLLHPLWEARHGAALGLREILRTQAKSAGIFASFEDTPCGWLSAGCSGLPRLSNAVKKEDAWHAFSSNEKWLEECCIHLVCTLALDRFGDFVSDQVVAPVRETAAQALGMASCHLNRDAALELLKALGSLSLSAHWEPRHGGLQGLKYLFASREIDEVFLRAALPICISGLKDNDDDVRAVAAESLLPASKLLAYEKSPEAADALSLVWDALLIDDPLSPAIKGATTLLAAVHTAAEINPESLNFASIDECESQEDLTEKIKISSGVRSLKSLIPRLWPHLCHQLTSVRLSSTRCLAALLKSNPTNNILTHHTMRFTGRFIYQQLIMEDDDSVERQLIDTWHVLVSKAACEELEVAFDEEQLSIFFALGSLSPLSCAASPLLVNKSSLIGLCDSGMSLSIDILKKQTVSLGDANRAASKRLILSEAIGLLAYSFSSNVRSKAIIESLIRKYLNSNSSFERIFSAFVVSYWSFWVVQMNKQIDSSTRTVLKEDHKTAKGGVHDELENIVDLLFSLLMEAAPQFKELEALYSSMQRHLQNFVDVAKEHNIHVEVPEKNDRIQPGSVFPIIQQNQNVQGDVLAGLNTLKSSLLKLQGCENALNTTVTASIAAAAVNGSKCLPPKLNSLIKPLIAAVRREPHFAYQKAAAEALARLVHLTASRKPSPRDKIVTNVCCLACGDPDVILKFSDVPPLHNTDGNSSLQNLHGTSKKGQFQISESVQRTMTDVELERSPSAVGLARRGAEIVLKALVFDSQDVSKEVPELWSTHIKNPLESVFESRYNLVSENFVLVQDAIHGLRILEVISGVVQCNSVYCILDILKSIIACICSGNRALLISAANCLASIAVARPKELVLRILDFVIPNMSSEASADARLGSVFVLNEMVSKLGLQMVSFVQLVLVPLLGRMSDTVDITRSIASKTFANVVSLMPLAHGAPPPDGLSKQQQEILDRDGNFLSQLLDNEKVEDVTLPFDLENGAKLRRYQQEGINWLNFLRRFGLHGVLADDMGLGKTLQATAIMGIATFEEMKLTNLHEKRPSLIVCPSTLVAHWSHEIAKFVDEKILHPLQYSGGPTDRKKLWELLPKYNVVVTSYETLRSDVDLFSKQRWLYCILDEGHAIRNPSSKISQATRSIEAQHRIILSGTPIQNSVLELWSLFDFLMPGFLGNHRSFNARYCKALVASRNAASKGQRPATKAEAEAGVLALDALHRQVMPFVLRRTKDQVLSDLPPKTVQDVICELSPLQKILYEDFSQSQALAAITGTLQKGQLAAGGKEMSAKSPHIFQALHYLRKLCSHPILVLDHSIPDHVQAIQKAIGGMSLNWHHAINSVRSDVKHAPKLAALKELLIDAGIGLEPSQKSGKFTKENLYLESSNEADDAGHRALVFAQNKALLDIVEVSVLQPLQISSLRIDGGVDAAERFRRVQQFNADPTIGVMLLTTAVGGLGLNLTAADTVVFLEHDWNPQKDLQAMDRAHRLGQNRAVNVYRLLMRSTLEERIMSLQKFKLDVAETVVNAENVSLGSMDTGNLLDLFVLEDQDKEKTNKERENKKTAGGAAAIIADLPDLDEVEAQYDQEFDIDEFKKRLKKE